MIYLDNAATTAVAADFKPIIDKYLYCNYSNPSSPHFGGAECRRELEGSRANVANLLCAEPENVIFTASGSEANTLAILGMANHLKEIGKTHIITSASEHASVRNAMLKMQKQGFDITYLPTPCGTVNADDFEAAITGKTGFASIMYVNNEHGLANELEKIYEICKENDIFLHSDCVQAVGWCEVGLFNADAITISGHKIHAPKGIGCLCTKGNAFLESVICGGSQENGKRGGTENLAFIKCFETALQNAQIYRLPNVLRISEISYCFEKHLNTACFHAEYNVQPCGNKIISVRFDGISADVLIALLSMRGVFVSSASACSAQKPNNSLLELGLTEEQAKSTLRISFGVNNTKEEVAQAAQIIADTVNELYKQGLNNE